MAINANKNITAVFLAYAAALFFIVAADVVDLGIKAPS